VKKSVANRLKITKTGKILRRVMGQSHNLAKKRSAQIKRKKQFRQFDFGKKIVKKYL
jgi:ribosomal protein L35